MNRFLTREHPNVRGRASYLHARFEHLLLALLAFVPPLLTSRGMVSADTKSYLYLDPAKLLSEATSMWNPNIGNGTVTHQTLGYLWPMGPFFRLADMVGIPDWTAQRLWWGLLVYVAAVGTRRLAREMGASAVGSMLAAGFYAFSPYFLQYFARLSGLLLPWVGLPWLMWCVIRAREDSSWKWPALFALIVATVGTVNATSLIMVGIGPLLWLAADAISKTTPIRQIVLFVFRTGVLCLGVSAWWLLGLAIQGKFGLPILRYTESYETVAKASSAQELVRGLGYWFFYGGDKLGRWVGPSTSYLTRPFVMIAGWTLSGIALLSLSLVRTRFKFHFVFVFVCALGVAIGAAPISSPSPYGRVFDRIVHNESGFALRSTPRAAPVVLLILALSLSFGVDRFRQLDFRARWNPHRVLVGVCLVALVVNFHPWFLLRSTTPAILRTENLPADWVQTAAALNADSKLRNTLQPARTYEFPGSDFANYTWGGTIDPITPGIADGGYIARELVPYGSDSTADLLNAYEARLQEGWFEPQSLTEFARFISANRLVMRNDLQHERFRSPRPEVLWRIVKTIDGLAPLYSGSATPADSYLPIIDNSTYGTESDDAYPSVASWSVAKTKPILTTTPLSKVIVLSGSGDGIVDALASRTISPGATVVYKETLRLRQLQKFDNVESIVVSDSNRRAARRWFSVGSNLGRVERAEEVNPRDPTDNRLMPFVSDPNATSESSSQTVSVLVGDIESVSASSFGNQVTYTPEDRPENAFDGDVVTAWRAGVFSSTSGQRISATLRSAVSAKFVDLLQPATGVTVRKIERFRILLDNGPGTTAKEVRGDFEGSDSIRLNFSEASFRRLTFEVLSDSFGKRTNYAAAPGIGLAEISIPGVTSTEYLRVPIDSGSGRPTYIFTRRRIDPSTPNRFDPDFVLRRQFKSPSTGQYRVTGEVRLNPFADDAQLARLIGATNPFVASQKSDGNILATGLNAHDGDLLTAWISPMDSPVGSTLTGEFGERGDEQLTLIVRTGDKYSVPRAVRVYTGSKNFEIELPLPDSTGRIMAKLAQPLADSIQKITVTAVRQTTFPDYFSNAPRVLPFALSEIYTTSMTPLASYSLSQGCRGDLVQIDGQAVPVRLNGEARELLRGGSATIELCGAPIDIVEGTHFLSPPSGYDQPWLSGWNLDRIVVKPVGSEILEQTVDVGNISILSSTRTSLRAEVSITEPSVLSFGQSINSGWSARLRTAGGTIDLGEPFVVNGYANGWVIPEGGTLFLEWTPQRSVLPALLFSLFVVAACLAIVALGRRKLVDGTANIPGAPWWIIPACVVVFAGPIAGLVAFVGAFLRPRVATALGALIGGATVGWIVLSQWYYRWPPNLDWPGRFNSVTWLALAFLVVAGTREKSTV